MIRAIRPETSNPELLILDSRDAILPLAPLLEQLADRCGQPGAMHWLPYFLDESAQKRKSPLLVLLLRPERRRSVSLSQEVPQAAGKLAVGNPGAQDLGADDLQAAALYSEYRLLGRRIGTVATEDAVGFRTVIAPEGERAQVAIVAARALVEHGAEVVLATFDASGEPEPESLLAGWSGVLWADRKRVVGRALPLEKTFDETLARMGKSTRFNLRYYRRRLQKKLDCEFVADAGALLLREDLQAINAGSLNPVSKDEFRRRVESASTLPGSYLLGLRVRGGPWLSLIGGWRQGKTSVLHWQMNSSGWEKDSIGTVMRCYLLEHEIALGAETLLIHGGTGHTMRHSFQPVAVTDLILRRRSFRAFLVQKVARFFVSPWSLTGRPNFLAETLRSPELEWAACPAPQGEPDEGAARPGRAAQGPVGLRQAR